MDEPPEPTGPPCGHAGCRREADYRVVVDGRPERLRCRWHVDAAWRPHGAGAEVTALHGEVPPIDPAAERTRRSLLPALLLLVTVLVVVLGFAVIAPLMTG